MAKKDKTPQPAAPAPGPIPAPFTVNGPGDPTSLLGQNIRTAQQNIRGGYAARGLAGSGIAQAGENNAVNSLVLQDMQRQVGNLNNFIAAGSGQQSSSSSGGGGMTVICSELHRQGLLDDETYTKDTEFANSLDPEVYVGYLGWAVIVADLMRKSPIVTWLVSKPALAWARYMSTGKGVVGCVMMTVGVPLCRLIGKWRIKRFSQTHQTA